jgi:solute carrier family 13 (sodium-dependent dicarboxylate transporter), member 2/3/5
VGVATTAVLLWLEALPREGALMAGIFVVAALLWVTEAVPLFATSLFVIALQVVLLANPGDWPGLGFEARPHIDFRDVVSTAADPVLVLFFGGLVLARCATREGVDHTLAGLLLGPVRSRPWLILLMVMFVTAFFSMWMSNTATAAMMVALVASLSAHITAGRFRKGLFLSVPFAANIGGMGTPVGSPPNAVAVGFLERAGIHVDFLGWMAMAVPLMLGLLILTWLVLGWWYRSPAEEIRLEPSRLPLTRRGWAVLGVMSVTMLLWVSEQWHGLPAAFVALVPPLAFAALGLLNRDDINNLEWNVLILIAGGISLGAGMQWTGLGPELAGWLTGNGGAGGLWLLWGILVVTMLLSNFMSNTAAANLLLPVGTAAVAAQGPGGVSVAQVAISIALTASVSMALPVSTPPNSIAYARGGVGRGDMARAGVLIGLVALGLIAGLGGVILRFWDLH